MAAQMNYSYMTPNGVPGGKFDISFDEVVTRINGEDTGVMVFGVAVVKGDNPGHDVKMVTTASQATDVEGIAINHVVAENDRYTKGKVIVPLGAPLGVMKKGHIWARYVGKDAPEYGAKAYVSVEQDNLGWFTKEQGTNLDIGATFGNAVDLENGIVVINL